MYKKVLLSIVCLCIGFIAKAADTDLSQYDNVIYGKKLTAMAGSKAKLSVMLKNNVEVPNLQFDIDLPTGVTIAEGSNGKSMIELSNERLSSTSDNVVSFAAQEDGSMRIMITSQTNSLLLGNDGEIVIITLNISDELSDGDYPIIIKNTVISDKSSVTYKPGDIESTLEVGKPEYSKGYSVQIQPFTLIKSEESKDFYVSFNITEGSYNSIEFDIVFPKEWETNEMLYHENAITRGYTYSGEAYTHWSIKKNTGSVSSTIKTNKYTLYYSSEGGDYSIPQGIYPIQITNIVATDADGNKYYAAPTTTYVKVGEPTESDIALEGHVTKDVTTALANETSLTKIDMSKVVSIDGSLTLRDKCDLIAPKYDVHVSAVTYKRSSVKKWGTICLPYEVTSSTTIQYYKLKEVGESTMTFEPVSTVEAGTPAVFRLLDENETVADMSVANAVLKAGNKKWTGAVDQWEMKGTYTNITIDPTTAANDIYYIATDKIFHANQSFKVAAYRGWFETPKSSSSKSKAYSVGFGDDNTTGIDLIEKENGEIDLIFDLGGKQLPQTKKGINIINNKKVIVK